MIPNTIENYLRFITPVQGDPTYSLLKSHLLIEELLRSYLRKALPNPDALSGSRLTFAQILSVARACSVVSPDNWCWVAVSKLNKLRNMLSHETDPKDISKKIQEYVDYVVSNSGVPLPEPEIKNGATKLGTDSGPAYMVVELATIGLYYSFSNLLGFDALAALDGDSRQLQVGPVDAGAG